MCPWLNIKITPRYSNPFNPVNPVWKNNWKLKSLIPSTTQTGTIRSSNYTAPPSSTPPTGPGRLRRPTDTGRFIFAHFRKENLPDAYRSWTLKASQPVAGAYRCPLPTNAFHWAGGKAPSPRYGNSPKATERSRIGGIWSSEAAILP